MNFIIVTILIACLQLANKYLLQYFFPKYKKIIHKILILIHIPLIIYATSRFTCGGNHINWLRSLVNFCIYFQLLTFIMLFVYLMFNIVTFIVYIFYKKHFFKQWIKALIVITISIMLFISCVIYGKKGAKSTPRISYQELSFTDLPIGLDGLRIAHISDLHSGPLVNLEQIKSWRYIIEKENPELLLITGDIVDSLPSEVQAVVNAFDKINIPLGCFAVLGNHDYINNPNQIWQTLTNNGIYLLENSNVTISRNGNQLAIVGLQDQTANNKCILSNKTYGIGPHPEYAIHNISNEIWRICLIHNPNKWQLAKKTGAKLTLAGHTHGGQINIIPKVSSAFLLGKYTSGLYCDNNTYLYVNRGLGTAILPLRIGSPPEIAIITLRRS